MTISQLDRTPQPNNMRLQAAARSALMPLTGILVLAIVLRLIFILILDPNPTTGGGDAGWYLSTGLQLVTNNLPGPIVAGPGVLLYLGLIQLVTPAPAVMLVTRLLNIGWQVILISSVYFIGLRYIDRRAALLAAFVVAINPMFIIESGAITTENLYLGTIFGAFALYATRQESLSWRWTAVLGVLLGFAALTRAVFVAFPLILIIHQIRIRGWRPGLKFGLTMIIVFSLTLLPWTVFNLVKWNRFVVAAGNDVLAFIWMGAKNETRSSNQVDAQLGTAAQNDTRNQAFQQGIFDSLKNLPQYLRTRLSNWADGVLQPHNTVYFGGESLKAMASKWLATDRSLGGLVALSRGDAFWPKLILYIFHFWALGFGALGLWLNRRRFWIALPIFGYLGYTLAIHLVLIALPRYIYPVEPILILFAASATLAVLSRLRTTSRTPDLQTA